MKPNAFQKILALVYFVLISVCCIFYVPFRNTYGRYQTEIVYDAIWSDKSNIDLYRIGIYLILLSVSFYLLYRYLNRMSDLDETDYKRKAKLELVTFLVFISGIVICLLFLICSNGINQMRKKSLTEEIQKTQYLISEKSAKREVKKANRINFWHESRKIFNLDAFNNNIQNYWEALMKKRNDAVWLNSFYGMFPSYSLNQLNLKTADDLKQFLEYNSYDNDDVSKQEEVKVLNENLNPIIAKRDSLTFYQDADIRKIVLITIAILFGLLYIVRSLFTFIKGIFIELK